MERPELFIQLNAYLQPREGNTGRGLERLKLSGPRALGRRREGGREEHKQFSWPEARKGAVTTLRKAVNRVSQVRHSL